MASMVRIQGMPDLICYCFNYTAEDIQHDLEINGRSTILEKIKMERESGGCNCVAKHPKGR